MYQQADGRQEPLLYFYRHMASLFIHLLAHHPSCRSAMKDSSSLYYRPRQSALTVSGISHDRGASQKLHSTMTDRTCLYKSMSVSHGRCGLNRVGSILTPSCQLDMGSEGLK